PEQNPDDSHQPENRPKHQPGGKLTEHYPPPIAELDLSKRERSDDKRRCLRPGISTGADDERNEEREHNGLLELSLKVSHRCRGQHLTQKKRGKPGRALADHREESDLSVRHVERFHSAE